MNNKMKFLVLSLTIPFILSACFLQPSAKMSITVAKIVTAVDEKLMPINVTDVFPAGTPKIFCWFQWRNAEVNTTITAKWYFVTDNVHILDYTFTIPRKEGFGSVSLAMPEGKNLPSGSYRVDLMSGKRLLKSLTFKVE